jgi:DNA-binding transcriptional ArsR family regulator
MPPDHRGLLLDVDVALRVRREVGPVAWLVLEAIASLAPLDKGVVEVACSARSLSEVIGMSKDTVARSLASMIALGVVERVDHRDELSGRFLSATYRVDLSTVGISVVVAQMPAPVPSTSAPARSLARMPAAQLSLLS